MRLLPAAFALLLAAVIVRAIMYWTDGGGGRSDAAALIFVFLCGAPLWLPAMLKWWCRPKPPRCFCRPNDPQHVCLQACYAAQFRGSSYDHGYRR